MGKDFGFNERSDSIREAGSNAANIAQAGNKEALHALFDNINPNDRVAVAAVMKKYLPQTEFKYDFDNQHNPMLYEIDLKAANAKDTLQPSRSPGRESKAPSEQLYVRDDQPHGALTTFQASTNIEYIHPDKDGESLKRGLDANLSTLNAVDHQMIDRIRGLLGAGYQPADMAPQTFLAVNPIGSLALSDGKSSYRIWQTPQFTELRERDANGLWNNLQCFDAGGNEMNSATRADTILNKSTPFKDPLSSDNSAHNPITHLQQLIGQGVPSKTLGCQPLSAWLSDGKDTYEIDAINHGTELMIKHSVEGGNKQSYFFNGNGQLTGEIAFNDKGQITGNIHLDESGKLVDDRSKKP